MTLPCQLINHQHDEHHAAIIHRRFMDDLRTPRDLTAFISLIGLREKDRPSAHLNQETRYGAKSNFSIAASWSSGTDLMSTAKLPGCLAIRPVMWRRSREDAPSDSGKLTDCR